MSSIIVKAFDASKKIFRSIFKGAPNLITTSDLNRQMEAFKYQMDQLDEKTGVLSDLTLSYNTSGGTLNMQVNYSYMEVKGCSFEPPAKLLSINLTASAPIAYLLLIGGTEEVTFDSDFTHDIAGAKFADGTALPAANQLRYYAEAFSLSHSAGGEGVIAILATIELTSAGNVVVSSNCIPRNNSLKMNSAGTIKNYSSATRGKIQNGVPYDTAFSIIENRFANLVPSWTYFTYVGYTGTSSMERNTDISFRIVNGIFYINMLALEEHRFTTRLSVPYVLLGGFPSAIRADMLAFFKSLGIDSRGQLMYGGVLPLGQLMDAPLSGHIPAVTGEDPKPACNVVGRAKVCLMGSFTDNVLTDVVLGMYVDSASFIYSDGSYEYLKAPVDWLQLQGDDSIKVYYPRFIGMMPLTGPI